MNEQTVKLINDLAQKLGTTAEHLWSVLIRQAPISASCDLLFVIAKIVGSIFFWKLCLRLSKNVKSIDDADDPFEWLLPWVSTFVTGIIAALITINVLNGNYSLIFSGYINPEYWAFKQIVH